MEGNKEEKIKHIEMKKKEERKEREKLKWCGTERRKTGYGKNVF
jgi:hypothetical protein